jgi:hypothetical protein
MVNFTAELAQITQVRTDYETAIIDNSANPQNVSGLQTMITNFIQYVQEINIKYALNVAELLKVKYYYDSTQL